LLPLLQLLVRGVLQLCRKLRGGSGKQAGSIQRGGGGGVGSALALVLFVGEGVCACVLKVCMYVFE